MALPDFIGLGVQRGGTTWLYKKLQQHPRICFPKHRKEAHFFDRYYERGRSWYSDIFNHCMVACKGEITPDYLYEQKCPKRIYELLPGVKLFLILRNPIDRAYSHYKKEVRDYSFDGSFSDFAEDKEGVLERGLYYEQITRYLQFFSREQILILYFSDLNQKPDEILREVFKFLEVDPSFEPERLNGKENASRLPRYQGIYARIKDFVSKLYDWDLVFLVDLVKKMGAKQLFFSGENQEEFPPLKKEDREELTNYYKEDVRKLSELLDKDLLDQWDMKP